MTGGGPVYFSSALLIARMIRGLGCGLPIELWLGDHEEVPRELVAVYEQEGIFLVDATAIVKRFGSLHGKERFYEIKPVAMVFSRFREVLLLDADNFPLRSPMELFASSPYRESGALFWPDFQALDPRSEMWEAVDLKPVKGMMQESGQILVDKVRHWAPLVLALHFNVEHDFYYRKTNGGDKETYHYAWRVLRRPFFMIPHPVASAGSGVTAQDFQGHTMLQHDLQGRPLFLHRNLRKYTSGFKPSSPPADTAGGIPDGERSWITIKQCAGPDPEGCPMLSHYRDGAMVWRDSAVPVTRQWTKTVSFLERIGWDVEAEIWRGFWHLFDSPVYAGYIHDLTVANGPPGEYHVTCKEW